MPIRMLGSRHLIGAWGSLFDPVIPITVFIQINHRDWSECAETSNERARVGQYLFRGIDGHAPKFCGQNLTQFQSVIQLQESRHLVCSVRRRDKRQPSLEQQERSDEH
jgi:hypothetical protein